MDKEVISQKQAIIIMAVFIIGSTPILGVGTKARQDVWIAILLAMGMACIIYVVYGRMLKLYPGKGLYEIIDLVFGKIIGRFISLLYVWFSFHLGALIIRNFAEYIQIVSMPETPLFIFAFMLSLLTILAVRGGIEIFGRWISIFFPIIVFFIFSVSLLAIPILEYENLTPILYNGLQPVIIGAYNIFAYPFAEVIVVASILGHLQKKGSPYKVYYLGMVIGGFVLLVLILRTILTLGISSALIQSFFAYASVRLINVGNFLQRIEVTISTVFIISGFVKSTVCLYSVTKGVSSILGIKNSSKLAAPFGLLVALFSTFVHKNTMAMFDWAITVYPYYVIPFQIILPVLIWITAEIKARAAKKKGNNNSNAISSSNTDMNPCER